MDVSCQAAFLGSSPQSSDLGTQEPLILWPHLPENTGILSTKQADGGELHMGGFNGPELEVAHVTLTHMLLAKTKLHGCAQLQGRLGNVV